MRKSGASTHVQTDLAGIDIGEKIGGQARR